MEIKYRYTLYPANGGPRTLTERVPSRASWALTRGTKTLVHGAVFNEILVQRAQSTDLGEPDRMRPKEIENEDDEIFRSSASHQHCSSLDEARPLKVGDAHPPLAPLPPLPPSQPPPSCSPLSPSSHPPRLRHLLHILPSPHHRLAAVHRCFHRRLQSLALHLHRHILSAKSVPLPPPPPPSPAPFTTT